MMKAAKAISLFDRVIEYFAYVAGVLVVFVMLSISAEVVSRYLFGRSIVWSLQFCEYSLLYITFFGGAWLLKKEGHPSLDILLNYMKPKTRDAMNMIMSLVGGVICFLVACSSMVVTYQLFLTGARDPAIIEVPKGPLVAIIPIGSFLISIQFFRRAHGYLRALKETNE